MNNSKLAYMAGVFDARGYVNINFSRRKISHRGFVMNVKIMITCTKEVITQLLEDSGMKWRFRKLHRAYRGPIACATITNLEDDIFFLKQLLPYLITYKKTAELVIEYCESRITNGKYSIYTDAQVELAKKINRCSSVTRTKHEREAER